MAIRHFVPAIALAGAAFAFTAPAHALGSKECGALYQKSKAADTLKGMNYSDFRKANCGADAAPGAAPAASATPAKSDKTTTVAAAPVVSEPTAANTERAPEPAAPSKVAPKGVPFPQSIDKKYASQTPAKGRMHTCLDAYHANKDANKLAGLKWIMKGGGYYSLCNAKLKS